jgi:D-alanyl-D-alanine carboxypeptidase
MIVPIVLAASVAHAEEWPQPKLRPGLSADEIAAAVAGYAQEQSDARRFSGVVLVAKAGKTILSRAYGLADVATRTPNTTDTLFNIGSLNKQFTMVAIEQLAQAGKLSLDDTIAKHLPDVKLAGADTITLRQLLDHRSGMGDIFGPKYDAAPPSRLRELSDFLPLFAGDPLGFAPGTSQRYSNAGYIVLGLVVERLSGETYRDYVARHIFAPAGITHAAFAALDDKVAGRATGYTSHGTGGERVPNTPTLPGRPSSAGGAYLTAGDLLRFFDARPARDLGVAGGAPGVNAAVEKQGEWTVIVVANYDPPAANALARAAMAIIRGR